MLLLMIVSLYYTVPGSLGSEPPILGIEIEDPEYENWWEPSESPEFWKAPQFQENYTYDGYMYAGRAEFNWIVDVRLNWEDQESWSTGNLITQTHVLATCHTMGNIQGLPLSLVLGSLRIHFASIHLWENPTRFHKVRKNKKWVAQNLDAGTRFALRISGHPGCSGNKLIKDAAVVTLTSPIRPHPPLTGFMPVIWDVKKHQIPDVDLKSMKRDGVMCYVASWGRNYRNWKNHYAIDYKTRMRVYYYHWSRCEEHWEWICEIKLKTEAFLENRRITCPKATAEDLSELMCFKSRAKVGTVCDHDHGSPVVCDGAVVGMVTHGATWKYCNSRLPLPFIVLKMKAIQEYFSDILHIEIIWERQEEVESSASANTSHFVTTVVGFILIGLASIRILSL